MIVEAWKYCLRRFAAAFFAAAAVGYVLLNVLGQDPQALLDISTTGIRRVTGPAIERAGARGLDPAIVIFFANLSATLFLSSFILTARIYDPRKTGKVSGWIRRQAEKDPTNKLLMAIPSYRALQTPDLRPLYTSLLVLPVIGAVALGVMIGLVFISYMTLTGGGLKNAVISLAYLLPHGIPEVCGILLGIALPLAGYMEIRPRIEKEDVEGAFSGLYQAGSFHKARPILGAVIVLLIGAAWIEAHLTGMVGRFIENSF